jgi:uncharacterized RDD family membrane protein YckC
MLSVWRDSVLDPSADREASSYESGNLALSSDVGDHDASDRQSSQWRSELEQRLGAYRARRGATASKRSTAQSTLPFGDPAHERSQPVDRELRYQNAVGVAEQAPAESPSDEDFSFTIAIGRYSPPPEKRDGRVEIDVSVPPGAEEQEPDDSSRTKHYGLYPVASLEDRCWAALVDVMCLMFAYGGFLALFSSLGGQFTLSKLSFEVYAATLAIVYLQYFALFTVFGGTTPGMMFRGIQVSSFTGESPRPRQMLLRSLGYIISASTLFMGVVWAWWDEDALTWHDRISHTYLTSPESRGHINSPTPAHSR